MASRQSNVDFVLEQMSGAGEISARKMFGEYGIYCGAKLVALFCDDQLFLKPTVAGRAFIGQVREGSPYPGAKSWFLVTGDLCEDGEWLSELVRRTAAELPMPLPKTKKATQTKSSTRKKAATARKAGVVANPSRRGAKAVGKKQPRRR